MILSNNSSFILSAKKKGFLYSNHCTITLEKEDMNSKAPGYLGSVWPDENPCQYISYDYLKNQQCAVYFVFLYYYHYIHL